MIRKLLASAAKLLGFPTRPAIHTSGDEWLAEADRLRQEVSDWRAAYPKIAEQWAGEGHPVTTQSGAVVADGYSWALRGDGVVHPHASIPSSPAPENPVRTAAKDFGLAYWVEGPKDDGLFWLYHRKTPDDLAEPVRGYTRRRNAQARAEDLQRGETEALAGLAEIAASVFDVEPTPDGQRFQVTRNGVPYGPSLSTQRAARLLADAENGK